MADMSTLERSGEVTLDVRKTVPWIIFVVFFAVLNETVFNVSTPAIAREFSLSASGVSWVMTTFIIFFGVGSVIYGKLSDIFSLRTLIVFGIFVYSAASLLGFALQFSYPAVVAARGLQGAGASAIPALITVLVARYIPPHERGKVFGTITSTVAFAIGIGPVIGGFVSGTLHWSLLFVIPLFTLIAVRFFLRTLPNEARKPGSVDIPGALLVASGVGTFMLFLTFGRWYFLAASILLLAGFVVDLLVAEEPFIELSLLRNDVFRKRVTVGFTVFAVVIGILFVVPLMLSSLRGLTTTQIGLVLFPGALASAALGTYGGNLADRRGNTFVVVIGFVLLVAGFVVLSLVLSGSFVIMGASLVLVYVGFNFVQTALFNSVSQMLDARDTGIGMGLFNLITFISGAVGTALIGRYLQGNWLSFVRNPLVADNARIYSNLILALIVFSAVAAVVYLRSARRQRTTTS